MTNYFSFHLSSKMISRDCCIIRHELTDPIWIKRLINDSIPIISPLDVPQIKALKSLHDIELSIPDKPSVIRLVDGDSLIVAEMNNTATLEDRVITGITVTPNTWIKFIKYSVSYFGDDDKERLDELEYFENSVEDNEHF